MAKGPRTNDVTTEVSEVLAEYITRRTPDVVIEKLKSAAGKYGLSLEQVVFVALGLARFVIRDEKLAEPLEGALRGLLEKVRTGGAGGAGSATVGTGAAGHLEFYAAAGRLNARDPDAYAAFRYAVLCLTKAERRALAKVSISPETLAAIVQLLDGGDTPSPNQVEAATDLLRALIPAPPPATGFAGWLSKLASGKNPAHAVADAEKFLRTNAYIHGKKDAQGNVITPSLADRNRADRARLERERKVWEDD